ncbi:MAG: glycosyltransferase [Gammaproteobacteria bacterium]|nr:glycosyltransferase [Gammaproteobacteria bacterium]
MNSFTDSLLPSLILVAVLMIWLPLLPRDRDWARGLVLGGAAILILRYMYWRTADTLPVLELSAQSLWPWLFYILEAASLTSMLIGSFIQTRTISRSAEATRHEARLRARETPPFVDVFIATYNEGFDVVERTIVGALSMDYPRYAVWVLDDGKRDWLRDYCKAKGARYLTRADNRHAKAGNLNNGLAVSATQTNGDLVMVLDADFVPRRDFLWRTVGFFDDPKIGIVQTPQHFFNSDPIQANLVAHHYWVDEQRYFFDIVQPSRDAWDVAFCCGTSSVVRRSHLDMIGGFPTDSVTEDVLLTYVLLQRGYITRYLNEPLSTGLAPEGLKEYLTQRSRWCIGTMQMLWLKSCPLWAPGLTLFQRISFLWLAMSWVVTFPWTLAIVAAPLLYLYSGIYVIKADWQDLLGYFAPAFAALILSTAWISNRTFVLGITDVTRLVMMFTTLRAIAQGLLRPFGQRFKVTAKGGDRDHAVVQWQVMRNFLILLVLNLLGIAINLTPGYAIVDDFDQQGINIFWSIYNMVLILITILVCVDLPRRRKEERFDINETSRISIGGRIAPCTIHDLSVSGARVRLAYDSNHARLQLDIDGVGPLACEIARTIDAHDVGMRFIDPGQRRDALIRKVYAGGYQNTPKQASPWRLLLAVLRRVFGHELV